MVVVKITGKPYLCQTDEIGELCVSSEAVGSSYWGLKGKTSSVFDVSECFCQLCSVTFGFAISKSLMVVT